MPNDVPCRSQRRSRCQTRTENARLRPTVIATIKRHAPSAVSAGRSPKPPASDPPMAPRCSRRKRCRCVGPRHSPPSQQGDQEWKLRSRDQGGWQHDRRGNEAPLHDAHGERELADGLRQHRPRRQSISGREGRCQDDRLQATEPGESAQRRRRRASHQAAARLPNAIPAKAMARIRPNVKAEPPRSGASIRTTPVPSGRTKRRKRPPHTKRMRGSPHPSAVGLERTTLGRPPRTASARPRVWPR